MVSVMTHRAPIFIAALLLPSVTLAAPLVEDVVRMLEAEVSEAVIFEFLETRGEPLPRLSADDVIALKKAGASDELMSALLAGSEPSPQAAAEPPSAEPPAVPPPPPAAVPPPPATGSSTTSSTAPATVRFRLTYDPDVDPDALEPPIGLYLYLDGRPLAWSDGRSFNPGGQGLAFEERLTPGRHVLRVLQERHEKTRRGFSHHARVCPEPIEFTVQPSGLYDLRVTVRETWVLPLKGGGALAWSLGGPDGGGVEKENLAGNTSDWPLLCEDLELQIDGSPNRREKRQLDACLSWADLWSAPVAPRSEVLDTLARYKFKPIPDSAR